MVAPGVWLHVLGMSNQTSPSSLVLITGGSRGLGRSMALHLAAGGADVLLTYRSSADEAAAVVRQIREGGHKAAALALDVTRTETFDGFVDAVQTELARTFERERIDALVNNGGSGVYASLADTGEDDFDRMVREHLKGPLFLTQKLAALIADGGRVLNVSSGLTRMSIPGYAAYAAVKGGLEVLTRYQAKELAARGITVNTLAPGAIETDLNGGAVRDNADLNRQLASITALGRVGLPDDIGKAVARLLGAELGWMTGQRIEVSGGMML